jgi:hypothetical protein
MTPGDAAYSPAVSVALTPNDYGVPTENPSYQTPVGFGYGWWGAPTRVSATQYIETDTGGAAGESKRLGFSRGIRPFGSGRQPFRGATVVPPRPPTVVVGEVGRKPYRSTLQSRFLALYSDTIPNAAQVAAAVINPGGNNG